MESIVVVGASLAGHHAARTLRHLGFEGRLTVIGAEPHHPYDRYPLSKSFLTGDTDRRGLDLDAPCADVTWRLGAEATGVDLARRVVTLDDRTRISFDGLVVASGARPRDSGRVEGLEGAFVLRTIEDAVRLRQALTAHAGRIVVVGGGLIGAEIASVSAGFGHHTTLVDSGALPTSRSLGLSVAEHVLALHGKAGVRVVRRTRVARLDHVDGRVTGVVLADQVRIPADVVVMATGTRPNVGWLENAGLDVRDGLVCGPSLHALGNERVVGAGDVVRAPHALLGDELVRAEHWASAIDQATLAATNLLHGAARSWCTLPRFGTTIHEARIRAVGFPQLANRSQVVWGSIGADAAVVVLFRGSTPVAAVSLNAEDRLDDRANALGLKGL